MRKIVGGVFQSLDGVMQAPGGPNEDPTREFPFGGWVAPFFDETMGQAMGGLFSTPFELLLGRKTYEIFAAHWPYVEGPEAEMGQMFTATNKYVVTSEPDKTDLGWENSHALADMDAVRALKDTDGPDLLIQGSTTLYPQLLAEGLLDRLFVLTFPIILGQGKRMIDVKTRDHRMTLANHQVSQTGVIIATYDVDGAVDTGSFAMETPSKAELARRARMALEG
ncbi:MAG: dihydrofolate reductase family protein [Pseudomonadota bacterium]|nr:dihydrofolate reductase family protein [Pseudomonadota bacterium]MEE3071321.1 dihydrofolate reductase family protein [Pseudomonadota bacterium]